MKVLFRHWVGHLVGLFAVTLASVSAYPCSVFSIRTSEGTLVGKNFDWDNGDGVVVTNARGSKKFGLTLNPFEDHAVWTSRYGSLSFNQVARDFPFGGINEKGLMIEILWLFENSMASEAGSRPAVNESQWIQYHLDRAAS